MHVAHVGVGLPRLYISHGPGPAGEGFFAHLLFAASAKINEHLPVIVGVGGPHRFGHVVIEPQPEDTQSRHADGESGEL